MTHDAQCAGYIQLVFFDERNNEALVVAGAGFITRQEGDQAWANIPTFEGFSCFAADRLDADGDIIDDRGISADVCEKLTGRPIAELIEQGRRDAQRLRDEWKARLAAPANSGERYGADALDGQRACV